MPRRSKPLPEAPPCASETTETEPCEPTPVQAPTTFRESAQAHAEEALEALVELVRTASSEHVRVAAANAILDRALGKPLPGVKAAADEGASDAEDEGPLEVRWLTAEDR